MISSFSHFFVKMMRVSISTKYKNKKKLSHLSLYDFFFPYNEGSEKKYLSYDQTKPNLLKQTACRDGCCLHIYFQDLQHGI